MIVNDIEKLSTPSAIAEYAREAGLLNMAENFSMESCQPDLTGLLEKYIKPYANESASKFGLFELRNAIAQKTQQYYDYEYDPEKEITITHGVKPCIFAIMLAMLKEGDEVIILNQHIKVMMQLLILPGLKLFMLN